MTHPFPSEHMRHQQVLVGKPRRSAIAVYELLNHHSQSTIPSPRPTPYSSSISLSPPSRIPTATSTSLLRSSPIRKHQQAPATAQKTTTRGPWRIEEDRLLIELVRRYGARHWSAIATHFPRRSGKQARERWMNQLNPALKKKNWTAKEDTVILQAHDSLGNRWSAIAQLLPGRTDNSVKNRFNSTLKRAMRERTQANASMEIQDIVSSLHARPFYHDQPHTEPKRFRPDFYHHATKTTMSSGTYDSNTSEERDLWVRGGNTNSRMAARVALASDGPLDVRKWGDACLPSISRLSTPTALNETADNRAMR